jgi:hypothetical protein
MISAGFLGGPCIGYKQDYFASQYLKENDPPAYRRYQGDAKSPLPGLPPIAGLDNAKVAVLKDDPPGKSLAEQLARKPDDRNLQALESWWSEAKASAAKDKAPVEQAELLGGQKALEVTAAVPAAMAVGYLLLLIYFLARGGYKAEVLVGHSAQDEKFTGGTQGPGEG